MPQDATARLLDNDTLAGPAQENLAARKLRMDKARAANDVPANNEAEDDESDDRGAREKGKDWGSSLAKSQHKENLGALKGYDWGSLARGEKNDEGDGGKGSGEKNGETEDKSGGRVEGGGEREEDGDGGFEKAPLSHSNQMGEGQGVRGGQAGAGAEQSQSEELRRKVAEARKKKEEEDEKKKTEASVGAETINPFRLQTSNWLRLAWLNVIDSLGITLIYIHLHVFLGLVSPKNFCGLGEEWFDLPSANKMGALKDAGKFKSFGIKILEVLVLALVDLVIGGILLLIFNNIYLIVEAITNPLEFLLNNAKIAFSVGYEILFGK